MAAKNRLREIRHELMIDKQNEMADLLGIQQQQYNRYEKQNVQPSLEVALRMAKKIKKSVEDIFYLEEEWVLGKYPGLFIYYYQQLLWII